MPPFSNLLFYMFCVMLLHARKCLIADDVLHLAGVYGCGLLIDAYGDEELRDGLMPDRKSVV